MEGKKRKKARFFGFFTLFLIFFLPYLTEASDVSLENDLQKGLQRGGVIVKKAKDKVRKGNSITVEITQLKTVAEEIRASHLLLQERFRSREEEIRGLGPKAQERHRVMSEGYRKAIEEYLSLIDSLPSENIGQQSIIDKLESILDKILHKRKTQIIGSLPYRNPNYPSREPNTDPPIKPAYKGGNKVVSPDDLKSTAEAPISQEIATLAQSLNWNPVSIYEYVKNNIEAEWYWGCMKGAEETLRQNSGNDCDQASLLIALLRASGFPSRYVRGTIEFFTTSGALIEKVKNLTGIDDPWKIAGFFQKAGIPYKPVISGGNITNFQIEHIWVESQIPYANYRGAIIDEHGKTWLGLDTSIKARGYTYNNPTDILQELSLSNIRDEYLSSVQTQTPLEHIRTYINSQLATRSPKITYNDLLSTRTLVPEIMNILPTSMQFYQRKITHEYTDVPDELKHKVRFIATDNNELFTITLDTIKLSNQKTSLSYEPETVEDQQIIDSYGGLDNTPAYLVRLRPVLKVNGERLTVGANGLPMGTDHNLYIELISPNGTEKITNTHITGNLSVIGIVAQKAAMPEEMPFEEKDAERLLYEEAINYIDRFNQAEEELATLMHLTFTRPIPTIVTIGGVIDVAYLLDIPHGYEWKGVYVDASLRSSVQSERQKDFMTLSGLQGSILENRIFEDDFLVESISTAKLFGSANSSQSPVFTINRTNIDILPMLPFDEDIKNDITNAVNQNLTIHIPQSEITYEDWAGIGYIKENPDTGESGYMLSGLIAGGMTAIAPEQWSNQRLREKLGGPYRGNYKTIIITSPKNETTVMTSQITVEGIVLDSKAKVIVNGVEAIADGNSFTATGIILNRGINTITAIEAGKNTSDTITVKYEIPLATYITFPYDSANLSVTPIDVEGIVSDPSASVRVNDIIARVSSDGRFIASGISLSEGANQITARATNIDGKTDSQTINVNYKIGQVNPISITITTPEANDTINSPTIMVKGTITSTAEEVSIKVNGILAEKSGSQFVANGVSLVNGNNMIIVNALDSNGAIGRAEITVKAVTTVPYITLNANITSGIPPLATYFSVSTGIPNPVTNYQIDFEGDGVIDYTGASFEDISHTYTTEGIFYPTVTVTDDHGNAYKDTFAITVMNKAEIDALLKGKWEGMKEALNQRNINSALNSFLKSSREEYKAIFELLAPQLPFLVSEMREITMIEVLGNVAEYYITRFQRGTDISYFIYFVRDADGIWKIDRF